MLNRKKANIGCGNTFITDGWTNLDYKSHHPNVIGANLVEELPLDSESFDLIYSSHFIEHIPKHQVELFLLECKRVLKKGGYIRFVVPDFEFLCREYVHRRDRGEHDKAEFAALQILDQCVRTKPGGELGSFYKYLGEKKEENTQLVQYVYQLSGRNLSDQKAKSLKPKNRTLGFRLKQRRERLGKKYIALITRFLPPAFRAQNMSFCEIGEKHAWMWDYWSLSEKMDKVGFVNIKKATHAQTHIPGENFNELDIDDNGQPRKGELSLFVEAQKPLAKQPIE